MVWQILWFIYSQDVDYLVVLAWLRSFFQGRKIFLNIFQLIIFSPKGLLRSLGKKQKEIMIIIIMRITPKSEINKPGSMLIDK